VDVDPIDQGNTSSLSELEDEDEVDDAGEEEYYYSTLVQRL